MAYATDLPPARHTPPPQPLRTSSTTGLVHTRSRAAAMAGEESSSPETELQLEDAVADDAAEGEPQISKTAAPASPPQPRRPYTFYLHAGARIRGSPTLPPPERQAEGEESTGCAGGRRSPRSRLPSSSVHCRKRWVPKRVSECEPLHRRSLYCIVCAEWNLEWTRGSRTAYWMAHVLIRTFRMVHCSVPRHIHYKALGLGEFSGHLPEFVTLTVGPHT